MSNERRQTALLALSTGLFFGWQFCLFPPMGAPVIFNALLDGNGALLAQMCVVAANVLACAALVVAVPRMSRELRPSRFMVASAIAQVAALALLAFAPTAAAKGVAVGVVSGAAVALGWACLILQYARVDVAVTEGAFVWSLPVAALSFLLPHAASWQACLFVLVFCAVAVACMCRWFENLVPDEAGGVAAPRGPWTIGRLVREDKEGLRILARCLVAYVCISICKPASGDQGAFVSEWSWVLYALGFSVAAFLLWLFASTSPGVGLNSLVKFVFPILALGVLLGSHGSQPAVAAGVLLLSSCHASFELANRGVVVALMRSAPDRCRLYGMAGMFVIGSGSLMGVLLYAVIGKVWPQTAAVASLAVVVLLLVLFFVDPSRGAFPAASAGCGVEAALEVRREAFAARHGLTKRETEVLGYILDGRSHPFIRDALGISKGTVDTHVRHIYQKCGVSSRQELISLTMDELDRRQVEAAWFPHSTL